MAEPEGQAGRGGAGGAPLHLSLIHISCALTPFLALSCSELTTIDLRYFEGDLLDTIAGLEPDIALTLYTASTTRLDNLFQYEHTEE